jgi:hypothetical protein
MSTKSVLVLVIAVAALGAGVGYVTMIRPARQRPSAPSPRDSIDAQPHGPVPSLLVAGSADPVTAEPALDGHRDLRVRNPADRPVTVRLKETDCGCAHVLVCVTPDAWQGLDAPELLERAADPALAWQSLEQGGPGFTLGPRAAGLLRLRWKSTQLGHHRFWAALSVDDGSGQGEQRVEVPVHFVEPVRIRAENDPQRTEIDVGRMSAGEERTARFLFTSETRDRFTLTPARPTAEPCVTYGTPQPLTPAELQDLSGKQDTAVRAGYRVTVTLREQAGADRLDIGPFCRPVVWKTDVDQGYEVGARISGTVLGEVSLAAPGGSTFVDLGRVPAADPSPLVFTLASCDPRLQLTVDEEKTLDFLKIELLDGAEGSAAGGGKTWRVRVLFRSDSLFRGKFPQGDRPDYDTPARCCIVFFLARPGQGSQPLRRLFVPVRGTVALSR